MPVGPNKKQLLIVVSDKTEEALRGFLQDHSKGYIPRGVLSAFVEEAIKEKLTKAKSINLDDLTGGTNG